MDEAKFAEQLAEVLELASYAGDFDGEIRSLETFAEAGVLTSNAGLVVRLLDGTAFQVTIVRSR